jgi:pteridine reductase
MVDQKYPLALVTGAARRLGRAFAGALAQQGYAILLHYHTSADAAEQTAEELRSFGIPIDLFQADLTVPGQIQDLFRFIDTLPYTLRILVNSAAIMSHGDVHRLTVEDWDSVFDLNLRAPFLLSQAAAERMPPGSLIVNLTDAGAVKAWTGYPAYSISKAGLEALTRLLAKALAPDIRINAIAPGLVLPADTLPPGQWEKLIERLPQKRPASVEQVVMALNFLIRNESITGQTLVVDGGYSLI